MFAELQLGTLAGVCPRDYWCARRVEAKGFTGHYMHAFGTLDDMLAAREVLAAKAKDAGVA